MPKVLVVNNYPSADRVAFTEMSLADNGAEVTSIDWSEASPRRFDSFDGAVLSGSPDMLTEKSVQAKYEAETSAILDSRVPILGICFGHQLIARAHGVAVVKDSRHVKGMVNTTVIGEDPLFGGLPKELTLLESREEVLPSLPVGFLHLAKSETTQIAAMRHAGRPLYGVAFHPERYTKESPDGFRVVGNFVSLLK